MGELAIRSPGAALALSVAGVCVRFEPASSEIPLAIPTPHVPFVVPAETSADCVVRCKYGTPQLSDGPASFSPGDAWQVRNLGAGAKEIAFFAGRGSSRELWQTLTLDGPLARGAVHRLNAYGREDAFKIGFPTDEFVHSRLLARRGALVVHASALLDGDDAFVFVGHSGAGKSTMARLAEEAGATVLSDDRTVIALGSQHIAAWGTPWHGTYRRGAPGAGILRGVFLLEQASWDRIDRLSPRDAIGEVFVRLMHPAADPTDMARCLATIEQTITRVPVGRLWFRPTKDAFMLAREWALDAAAISATIEG